MAEQVPPQRARLGAKLRQLRADSHRSGAEFARDLGWGQSKVSKLERGAQLPRPVELDTWVTATGGTAEDRSELGELLTSARLVYSTYAELWQEPGAAAASQREIAVAEQGATVIREYGPAMLPGLVQTPAYAKAMLSTPGGVGVLGAGESEIDKMVLERIRRQQLLYTPGKQIRILVGEAALKTRFGDPDVMAGQMDRLLNLAGLAAVDLAILPLDRAYPLIPVSAFAVIDDRMVVIETFTGEQQITSADEVAAFTAAFDAGVGAAVRGLDAAAMLRR